MFLPLHFFLNPCHNYIYKIILLHLTQFPARLHFVPLPDTLSAACCSCMLGNKYRMAPHRSLFAIICYKCGSFSLCNKVLCMLSDRIKSLLVYVIYVFLLQMKAASKFGIVQSLEQLPVPLVLCHQNFTTSGSCVNDENVAVAFLK